MNEENQETSGEFKSINPPDESEWQAPPLPEQINIVSDPPQMSEVGTLGSIFFEPGRTFEDLRRKPRFLLAGLISALALCGFIFLFYNAIGFEAIARARIESAEQRGQQMTPEQKEMSLKMQSGTIAKAATYGFTPLAIIVSFLIGGLIYWGGANAMGGSMTFLRGLAVWIYSGLPPVLVSSLANILILFLKDRDDIDPVRGVQGLIHANPSFFIDEKSSPVLAALLGTFDVFFIWGWILAAIGLRIVGKISTGAAWTIVLLVGLLNVAARVVGAFFQG